MSTKVVFIGTGAVGGYVSGHMTRAGEDVTLIDMWPEHVDAMRRNGLQLSGLTPEERLSIPVKALHVGDVQSLAKERPVDIAFVSTKSYDTEWAALLIKPYLAPAGFVVSLQNCINEERIASVVGWGRTLGSVISHIGCELYEPGHVKRTVALLSGDQHIVFRAGEVHGRQTARAEEVARLLRTADTARVTTNLWGQRWTKLTINAMGNGLSAVTGLGGPQRDRHDLARSVRIRLASEAVRVGQALGYKLEEMHGLEPEMLARAGEGEPQALAIITAALLEDAKTRSEENRPSLAQDMSKGRRTETDYINGYVAAKGIEAGVPAPVNAKMNELVRRVERGELKASVDNLAGL